MGGIASMRNPTTSTSSRDHCLAALSMSPVPDASPGSVAQSPHSRYLR